MYIHLGKLAAVTCAVGFGLSAPAADAAPKGRPDPQAECEAGGYLWDSKKGCANKTCPSGGKNYAPGSVLQGTNSKRGASSYWTCDGFSGAWEKVG